MERASSTGFTDSPTETGSDGKEYCFHEPIVPESRQAWNAC